jgi:two-component system, chemotaxis family, protein-glutamate methylesterase/glutaminase
MSKNYQAVVMGASAGGSAALLEILPCLPEDFPCPVIVVQHLHPLQDGPAMMYHAHGCAMELREAEEKEVIRAGIVYFAPPNYHLLIEDDRTFSLSIDTRVNFSRPAIDVLFESAADVYGAALIGIVLSGANHDGAAGLHYIKQHGGLAIVQEPKTAEVPYMPNAAIQAAYPEHVLAPKAIGNLLVELVSKRS